MTTWDHWTKPRVVAAFAVASAMAWIVHGRAVAPLRHSATELARGVVEVKERTENARTTMAEIRAEEKDASLSPNELEQMQRDLPAGPPLVWLPPMVTEQFTRSGLAAPVIQMKSNREDPALPGLERRSWLVRLPINNVSSEIAPLLLAVADLDQRNPFLRVVDFAIRPDSAARSKHSAVFHVSLLSPKARIQQ